MVGKNGKLHRDNDLPAIIETSGTGKLVQEMENCTGDNDLPAVVLADGTKEWWVKGWKNINQRKKVNE